MVEWAFLNSWAVEVYYYGCDSLFAYHPRVVQRLCNTAPTLLHTLMDGLVWRSRQTRQGWRRVNYYVKHLLKDSNGDISPNLASCSEVYLLFLCDR